MPIIDILKTTIDWAAINGQTEVIEFMIKIFNADPNLTNAMNKLPFDEAVLFNHKEAAVRNNQYILFQK